MILDDLFHALGGTEGKYRKVTYNLTSGNDFAVLQTPNLWGSDPANNDYWVHDPMAAETRVEGFGLPVCDDQHGGCQACGGKCQNLAALTYDPSNPDLRKVCCPAGIDLVEAMYETIISAKTLVDITTLQGSLALPDGVFKAAIRNALGYLARTGRRVTVRIMVGLYGAVPDLIPFLKNIVSLSDVTESQIAVYFSTIRTDAIKFSWNHSKIVAADGRVGVVGGHNMWTADYLEFGPVHDVSLKISGPAVGDAHRFAARLWKYVGEHPLTDKHRWTRDGGMRSDKAPPEIDLPEETGQGNMRILSLGRLGRGIVPPDSGSNASETVQIKVPTLAKKSLRISQQSLHMYDYLKLAAEGVVIGAYDLYEQTVRDGYKIEFLDNLADALVRGVDVQIVLSGGGTGVSPYGTSVPLEYTVNTLRKTIKERHRSLTPDAVNVLLARHLNLTALRFSGASATEWSWQKKKKPFFNHAKVYIIDDAVFYVGSDNLYPNNQQEFGYLVEGSTATARFVTDYWDKLWRYSGRYAINPSPGSVINRGGGGAT